MSKKGFRKFLLIAVVGTIGFEFILKAVNAPNGLMLVLTFVWALILAFIYFGIKGKEILTNTTQEVVPAFDREGNADDFIANTRSMIAENDSPAAESQGRLQIAGAQLYKREYENALDTLTSVEYNLLGGSGEALYWSYYIIAKIYLGEYEDAAAIIESNEQLFYNIRKPDDNLSAALDQVSIIKNWLAGHDELTDNLFKDAKEKWEGSLYEADFAGLESVIYEE